MHEYSQGNLQKAARRTRKYNDAFLECFCIFLSFSSYKAATYVFGRPLFANPIGYFVTENASLILCYYFDCVFKANDWSVVIASTGYSKTLHDTHVVHTTRLSYDITCHIVSVLKFWSTIASCLAWSYAHINCFMRPLICMSIPGSYFSYFDFIFAYLKLHRKLQ